MLALIRSRTFRLLAVPCLLMGTGLCVLCLVFRGQPVSRAKYAIIEVNMTEEQVHALLGTPNSIEQELPGCWTQRWGDRTQEVTVKFCTEPGGIRRVVQKQYMKQIAGPPPVIEDILSFVGIPVSTTLELEIAGNGFESKLEAGVEVRPW